MKSSEVSDPFACRYQFTEIYHSCMYCTVHIMLRLNNVKVLTWLRTCGNSICTSVWKSFWKYQIEWMRFHSRIMLIVQKNFQWQTILCGLYETLGGVTCIRNSSRVVLSTRAYEKWSYSVSDGVILCEAFGELKNMLKIYWSLSEKNLQGDKTPLFRARFICYSTVSKEKR